MWTIIVLIALLVVFAAMFFPQFRGIFESEGPVLIEETIEDTVETATVKDKYIAESGIRRNRFIDYMIVFETEDGKTLELSVKEDMYNEIEVGERETLVHRENSFVGFGDHAALDIDGEAPQDAQNMDDTFSYDDYDETIDVEIIDEIKTDEKQSAMTEEEKELFALFDDYEPLPEKISVMDDEVESFEAYHAAKLLEMADTYSFLKQNVHIRSLFMKVYAEALRDLEGYAGDMRGGRAADSVYINKSEFRLIISIQESAAPLRHKISAEFGVNG